MSSSNETSSLSPQKRKLPYSITNGGSPSSVNWKKAGRRELPSSANSPANKQPVIILNHNDGFQIVKLRKNFIIENFVQIGKIQRR